MVKNLSKREYKALQDEMAKLKAVRYSGYQDTLKNIGISYISNVGHSAKLHHSYINKVATLGIYLASSDLSGYNVCPKAEMCRENCLVGSGRAMISALAGKKNVIAARIKKTRLFFANREVFMKLLVHEIVRERAKAEKNGMFFSIRLNCTSDINPESFVLNGKNILEIFPDVVFYDYSKVPNRIKVAKKYKNYHLTWSIDGSQENLNVGLDYLKNGGHVAVVYGSDIMPTSWYGYKTEDGDRTDYRPGDIEPVCMLKFKKTANNFKNGKFIMPKSDFIVTENNPNCCWG